MDSLNGLAPGKRLHTHVHTHIQGRQKQRPREETCESVRPGAPHTSCLAREGYGCSALGEH